MTDSSNVGKVGYKEVSQIHNAFFHLVRELEPFVEVNDLRVSFNGKGNAFLEGDDFREQLHANFSLHRLVREELLSLIAKHRGSSTSIQAPPE